MLALDGCPLKRIHTSWQLSGTFPSAVSVPSGLPVCVTDTHVCVTDTHVHAGVRGTIVFPCLSILADE